MIAIGPDDPTEEQERRSAAFHEAGHVAVLHYFGIRVLSASIDSPREVRAEDLPDEFDPRSKAQDEQRARQRIVCYHAGKAAERKGCGTEPTAADGDLVWSFRIAALILGEDVDHPTSASFAYVETLRPTAIGLLERADVWEHVQIVSEALLTHGSLREQNIAALLDKASTTGLSNVAVWPDLQGDILP